MDNHESHEPLSAREYAKKKSIFIVTLPPHTSHRTQPLDRAVFGPMKTYMNSACDAWCLSNPGRAISIYDMADLIREAWLKACTPNNIISGFKVSGVWPFEKHTFNDESYLPSSVTDRPLPEPSVDQYMHGNSAPGSVLPTSAASSDSDPGPSNHSAPDSAEPMCTGASQSQSALIKSPVDVVGYPKAAPRKQSTRGRKRGLETWWLLRHLR